jgi:phage shock protein C
MPAVFGYFIAALVLKRRPEHLYASREEEAFWRAVRLEPSRTAHDLLRKFQELERRLRAAEARVTSSEFRLRRQFKDLEG